MIASKISKAAIETACLNLGIRAEITPLNTKDTRHRVKLFPVVPETARTKSGRRRRGEKGDARYQRTSASFMHDGRRVHAVCWHGFRDFFRACFVLAPEARFQTAMDTWNGSADFEARYRESGHRNVGAPIAPMRAAEVCRCGEQGMAI